MFSKKESLKQGDWKKKPLEQGVVGRKECWGRVLLEEKAGVAGRCLEERNVGAVQCFKERTVGAPGRMSAGGKERREKRNGTDA